MRTTPQEVRAGTRVIWGSFLANGAMNIPGSNDWRVIRTGTGLYTLKVFPAFRGFPDATANPGSAGSVGINPNGADEILITTFSAAGAAADLAVHFRVEGRALRSDNSQL